MVCLVLLTKCSLKKDETIGVIGQFGKSHNTEREKLGIPIIEDSWVSHYADSTGVTWMNRQHRLLTKEAHHFAKHITLKNGQLVDEEDSFSKFLNDSVDQRLIYLYDFKIRKWTCELSTHYYKAYPPGKADTISLDSADSILHQWGLTRFKHATQQQL